jgi:hypothetical protein
VQGPTGPVGATGATGILTITDTSASASFYIPFLSSFAGTATVLNVDNPGLTYNPSTQTLTTTTFSGTATQAKYADLAENYLADSDYPSCTVVSFGGDQEVTISTDHHDTAVAGIVTSNPAYLMNSELSGTHVVGVALMGRVPCRVLGPIRKGDLLVSAPGGYAQATRSANAGTIVGKSLEDFDGDNGVIEVVVGRT